MTNNPLRLLLIVDSIVGLIYNLFTRNQDLSVSMYGSITDQTSSALNDFAEQKAKLQQSSGDIATAFGGIKYLSFLEFFIGFFELASVVSLVYSLILLIKDPTSFGDELGTYKVA